MEEENIYVLNNISNENREKLIDELAEPLIMFYFINNAKDETKAMMSDFALSWFPENLREKYKDKDIVVVTHHAPCSQSISPEYVNDFLNPFYASDLSEFILNNQNIKVWCHGHIHSNSDYNIGETDILCNPYGYANYEGNIKPLKYKGKEFVLT